MLANPAVLAQTSVTTYHNDNLRTGWNATETVLTTASVGGSGFGVITTVGLDEQVDAQPLLVAGVTMAGQGTHDVVYVVTENDTLYAIDAASGAILLSRSLGTAVPMSNVPPNGLCNRNSTVLGIMSTPVIDQAAGVMYIVSYGEENGAPVYRVHALAISTLADVLPSVVVAATQTLGDGTAYQFKAADSRQRPGLLLSNGVVYAGFGSFCDFNRQVTRGWVIGWNAANLAPLGTAALINRQPRPFTKTFLSSVWMSGYGLAADAAGSVYFATGNSSSTGTTYNSQVNLAESVVKMSPDLTTVQDFFTPGGGSIGEAELDIKDLDFGSGGVLLLPAQPGNVANLAVAAGKAGMLYLLNQDALGGYVPNGPNDDVGEAVIGGCYCGQSYFTGADGAGRVVSSGGLKAMIWRVATSPHTALTLDSKTAPMTQSRPWGFFTSVSSNGQVAGSAVIWAVARPPKTGPQIVELYGYDGASGATLFSAPAGPWPNPGNANAVPVAANGKVYVASYKQLAIFGLK